MQVNVLSFLVDVGLTARTTDPRLESKAIDGDQRQSAFNELARDFPWHDEEAVSQRYSLLVNACQRLAEAHTLRSVLSEKRKFRFGFPHPRCEHIQLKAFPLTEPPADRIEDWQAVIEPP